jgi:hypothetical protein
MVGATLTARLSYPFAVVRKGKEALPRFRHATIEEAAAEAERRANARPGATFLVMQEVLRVRSEFEPPAAPSPVLEPGASCPHGSPGSYSTLNPCLARVAG